MLGGERGLGKWDACVTLWHLVSVVLPVQHRQVTSLVCAEIGGCNSIEPLIVGAKLGERQKCVIEMGGKWVSKVSVRSR